MSEIKNITKDDIQESIKRIDQNRDLRIGRESTHYDLVHNGEEYPPILVLSEANKLAGGEELTLKDFNNNTDKAFSILRSFGFKIVDKTNNETIQQQLITQYKSLVREDQNKPELYKWKLIKEFQEKWDIEADDFVEMLKSLDFRNLLDYRSLTLIKFSEEYVEEARSLFKMLYDESIPLKKRILDFGERSEKIVKESHPDLGAYQDERTIATYLTFRYPDKYTFYKYSIYSDYADLLEIDKVGVGERYIHYLELIDELIEDYISKDEDLINLSRQTLTSDCYVDSNLNILAQDILFRVTQQNSSMDENERLISKFNPNENNAWVEKTIVRGRSDREQGDYRLGKKLWSPRAASNGADIYSNMRRVKPGDLILHLTDNEGITGVSIASDTFKEGKGREGTDWEGDAYIIELDDFTSIKKIDRDKLLNEKHKRLLDKIRDEYDVFYNVNLNLRQGAYLTECPKSLLEIINSEYKSMTGSQLPYVDIKDSSVYSFNAKIFVDETSESGLIYSESVLLRFISSLLTKPFLILTGLSGSGKTKLAQAFAEWITLDESQVNLVPVGADWTNREPLLGYPNALEYGSYVLPDSGVLQLVLRAKDNPEKPFFLILDEMNLSHVERYFADFLSAIESEEKIKIHSGNSNWEADGYQIPSTLSIPKNLFIIGTVNIDETTYMFSPKVLDRANVIEFRVSKDELDEFLSKPVDVDLESIDGKGAGMATEFVEIAKNPANEYSNKSQLSDELLNFFEELNDVGAEFGYRTAFEINRFAGLSEQLAEDWEFNHIMDAAIAQKLLPKLHGSRRKLERVLIKLGNLCLNEGEAEEFFKKPKDIDYAKVKYPISFEKLVRMHKGLVQNGFTSFAEA